MGKIEIVDSCFSLEVTYTYKSFMDIGPMDDRLLDAVGHNRTSSLAENGNRTLVFNYMTKNDATNAAVRVLGLRIEGVDVNVYNEAEIEGV